MKSLAIFVAAALWAGGSFAQEKTIKLYDGPAPGSESWKHSEKVNDNNTWQTKIVYNVSSPTLTLFPADPSKANGTALIIAPGGAFHALSIDSEGNDVAKAMAAKGVTCFVLRYRLVEAKTEDPTTELMAKVGNQTFERDVLSVNKLAMADGLKAVEHVRKNAASYKVDPKRIGIMGFSAGGTVTASVLYNYTAESRPDFAAPIYLAYNWVPKEKGVPGDAPPIFISAASDDQLGLAAHSVDLYNDWLKAQKPVELHLYAKGGHGYGMRKQNLPTDQWIERFAEWLGGQGLLKP